MGIASGTRSGARLSAPIAQLPQLTSTHPLTRVVLVVPADDAEVAALFLQHFECCPQITRPTVTLGIKLITWPTGGGARLDVHQIHIVVREDLEHLDEGARTISVLRKDDTSGFGLLRLVLLHHVGSAVLQRGLHMRHNM